MIDSFAIHIIIQHSTNFWNVDYSPSDKQRLELDATRVAEGMMTYWLLEMSQRSVKGIH